MRRSPHDRLAESSRNALMFGAPAALIVSQRTAGTTLAKERPMSESTTGNATATDPAPRKAKTKKSAGAKAAKGKAKAAKPKPEKKPKAPRESREGWGTFALKMPIAERDALHAASGAAGASRFARIVLVAFANDDEAAFRNAIAEAKNLR